MLEAAGWAVQDARSANLAAARGVAVREFILEPPHGRADYREVTRVRTRSPFVQDCRPDVSSGVRALGACLPGQTMTSRPSRASRRHLAHLLP